jgi:hypothetical protein
MGVMPMQTMLRNGAMTLASLLIAYPAVAQSVPSSARSACVQRTAEEMGVATRDLSMIEAGPVSAESGARTLVFRNSNTGQTAQCRVNTIDNTVLSVTLGGGSGNTVPYNNPDRQPAPSQPATSRARFANLTASSGSRINVRSQPTVNSSAPHYGISGDRVKVLQCVQDQDRQRSALNWCKVQFVNSKAIGWVRSDFIVFSDGGE